MKTKLQEKTEKVQKNEEAVEVIREFEYFIKSRNRDIICFAYQKDKFFEKFKENAKFTSL